jgi:hypothetical protein
LANARDLGEEASREVMLDVEEEQRNVRSESSDTATERAARRDGPCD